MHKINSFSQEPTSSGSQTELGKSQSAQLMASQYQFQIAKQKESSEIKEWQLTQEIQTLKDHIKFLENRPITVAAKAFCAICGDGHIMESMQKLMKQLEEDHGKLLVQYRQIASESHFLASKMEALRQQSEQNNKDLVKYKRENEQLHKDMVVVKKQYQGKEGMIEAQKLQMNQCKRNISDFKQQAEEYKSKYDKMKSAAWQIKEVPPKVTYIEKSRDLQRKPRSNSFYGRNKENSDYEVRSRVQNVQKTQEGHRERDKIMNKYTSLRGQEKIQEEYQTFLQEKLSRQA